MKYNCEEINKIMQKNIDEQFNMAKKYLNSNIDKSYQYAEKAKMLMSILCEFKKVAVDDNYFVEKD